jgi:two-component system sensor histidine kinase KdpD
VVAAVDAHGRRACETALDDLELLGGPKSAALQAHVNVEALLRRNPDVACVDDLGATDTEGRPLVDSIPRLLQAGLVLIATLHLTDLRSTVEDMGSTLDSKPGRVVEDSVLDLATELEIVDVTPSVLGERIRRGHIIPSSQAARALAGTYRPEVLATLRELAFRVIAEHTDRRLVAYMRERGIEAPWEVKPRVMLCVPPRPGMEGVIAQVETLAQRLDGRFIAVTVRDRPRSEEERQLLGCYAALTHQAGGDFVTLYEKNPAIALAGYARRSLATQVVVTRGRGRRGTLRKLIRTLDDVDVHILPAPDAAQSS